MRKSFDRHLDEYRRFSVLACATDTSTHFEIAATSEHRDLSG